LDFEHGDGLNHSLGRKHHPDTETISQPHAPPMQAAEAGLAAVRTAR
jgi:hypothetical protein